MTSTQKSTWLSFKDVVDKKEVSKMVEFPKIEVLNEFEVTFHGFSRRILP